MQTPSARRIPGTVWLLGFISLLNDIASEILYPVLPIFLTQVLGTPVAILGVIEGFAEAAASFFKAFFGKMSDASGRRKPYVMGGYAFSAFSKLLIALSRTWPLVFVGRLTDKLGKGLRTGARDAMLLDASQPENRGLIFGIHRSLDSAGAVIGPLIALLLLHYEFSIRSILAVAVVPSFLAIGLFAFLRERPRDPSPASRQRLLLSLRGLPRPFLWMLLGIGLFSIGNSSDAFLILRSQDLGLSLFQVILAYVFYNCAYALLSGPAGKASDVLGAKAVMLLGLLIFAGVYLGFALTTSASAVWPLFVVYGAYIALTDGVSKAWAGAFIPKEHAATAYGVMHMVTGLCSLVASVAGGFLWSAVSPQATFLFAVVFALLGFAVLAFLPASGK